MGPTSSLRNIQKLFKHLLLLLRKKEIDQWKFIGSYSGSQMWKTLVIRSLVKYFTHFLIFTHTVMQFGIVIIDFSDMYVNLFELNLLFIIVEIIWSKGSEPVSLPGADNQIKREAKRLIWSKDLRLSMKWGPRCWINLLLW